jgi:hypothetical protein
MALDPGTYPDALFLGQPALFSSSGLKIHPRSRSMFVSPGLKSAFNERTVFARGEDALFTSAGLRVKHESFTLYPLTAGALFLSGLPTITPPPPPAPSYGTYGAPALAPRIMRQASASVAGASTTYLLSATVNCVVNGVNTATLTVLASDAPLDDYSGADAAVTVGGLSVVGRVTEFLKYVTTVGDESKQVCTFNVESYLADLDQEIVYPDVGSELVKDMRKPMVGERTFDFHSSSGFVEAGLTSSFSIESLYGVPGQERFPLPDFWPDPTARWMWGGPGGGSYNGIAGKGTVYFRTKTKKSRATSSEVQAWCCMYDSGEVRIDGKVVLECTNAGQAQRAYVSMSEERSHLITIRAHNGGGRGGVLFSLMPVETVNGGQRFGPSIVQSHNYWLCKAYSGNAPFSPRRIIDALVAEARMRGSSGIANLTIVNRAPTIGAEITMPVGISMLDALNQLAEAWIDYWVIGATLYIYPKGGGSGSSAVGQYTTEVTKGGHL